MEAVGEEAAEALVVVAGEVEVAVVLGEAVQGAESMQVFQSYIWQLQSTC
jgi:hypothetical protein